MTAEKVKKDWFVHAWWHTPVVTVLRKLRQEDWKFKANLSYISRFSQQKNKQKSDAEPEILMAQWLKEFDFKNPPGSSQLPASPAPEDSTLIWPPETPEHS